MKATVCKWYTTRIWFWLGIVTAKFDLHLNWTHRLGLVGFDYWCIVFYDNWFFLTCFLWVYLHPQIQLVGWRFLWVIRFYYRVEFWRSETTSNNNLVKSISDSNDLVVFVELFIPAKHMLLIILLSLWSKHIFGSVGVWLIWFFKSLTLLPVAVIAYCLKLWVFYIEISIPIKHATFARFVLSGSCCL